MNLILTNYCNRACPYCFAQEKINLARRLTKDEKNPSYISLANVDAYLDFLERSNYKRLKLLGGEPTLHPKLADIVTRGLQRNMEIIIFTNGLWSKKIQKLFQDLEDPQIRFVFNVNEPHLHKKSENRIQNKALKIAGKRGSISFNIHRENFDLLFLCNLLEMYGLLRIIRLGLACPIVGTNNVYLPTHKLEQVGHRLIQQLRRLEKRNILGSFDCGFPLCMFTLQGLGSLTHTTINGFSSICGSVIDVGPDLTAWPCFPLSRILNVKLTKFADQTALQGYFDKHLAPLRNFGSRERCLGCKYLHRGQCTGGCLGRTIRSWQESGDPSLLKKIESIR